MDNLIKMILFCLLEYKNRLFLQKKMRKITAQMNIKQKLSDDLKSNYKRLWAALGKNPDVHWLELYSNVCPIIDYRYISEIEYYNKVEPVLNNRAFSEAYSDKNLYHKLFNRSLLPKIFFRNMQGVYYSEDYSLISTIENINEIIPLDVTRIIVKIAVDSGGGRGVELYIRNNDSWINNMGELLTLDNLKLLFGQNYIVQEYIYQHPFFSQFNETSVNTIRLLTYRSVVSNEIIPLQSVLRIGKPGAIVDNQASGGISCGISLKGELNDYAVDKFGHKFESINGVVFSKIGIITQFQEIVDIGIDLAKKFPYHRLLGLDFCVDCNGIIKLIEINNKNNEINFYQMNNGPLFREYTEEVIEYCANNKKSVVIDYTI